MVRSLGRWTILGVAVTVAVASLVALGAPTPSLFGALLGAMVIGLVLSRPPVLPTVMARAAQAAIGVLVASEVDVAALGSLGWAWPAALGVIVLTLAVSIGLGQLLRRDGVSATTATFASVAGGASAMTALARDAGADPRIVAVVQYVRVLLILLTLPIVVGQVFATDAAISTAPPLTSGLSAVDLGYVAIACTVGPLIGILARFPSPALLGALVAGLLLDVVPFFDGASVPPLAQAAAFIVIGTQAGIGFTRETIGSCAPWPSRCWCRSWCCWCSAAPWPFRSPHSLESAASTRTSPPHRAVCPSCSRPRPTPVVTSPSSPQSSSCDCSW